MEGDASRSVCNTHFRRAGRPSPYGRRVVCLSMSDSSFLFFFPPLLLYTQPVNPPLSVFYPCSTLGLCLPIYVFLFKNDYL